MACCNWGSSGITVPFEEWSGAAFLAGSCEAGVHSGVHQQERLRSGFPIDYMPRENELQIPYFSGFPVEPGGFGKLHAPFFTERRTRCLVQRGVAGNPGALGVCDSFYKDDDFSWALASPTQNMNCHPACPGVPWDRNAAKWRACPERSRRGTRCSLPPAAGCTLEATTLPFVIPSEAEGSAVLQARPGNVFSTEY